MAENGKYIWKDRKRTIFGLPLSFTRYCLTEEKLMISTGLFSVKEEEIRLYRIRDLSLKLKFSDRIFGLGSIHICSSDSSTPELTMTKIKKARYVKELLSQKVESERDRKRVTTREYIGGESGIDDDDHF